MLAPRSIVEIIGPTQVPLIVVALATAVAPLQVCADLPVHCLRHEVVGEWKFTLGPLREQRSSCGHLRPDVETSQPSRASIDAVGAETQLMVMLRNPNIAATARDPTGNWTMIYDEGFQATVAGLDFFAFSNFTLELNAAHPSHRRNTSHCFQTMVGWYQNTDRTGFGCFYGGKVGHQPVPLHEATLAHVAALAHGHVQMHVPTKVVPANATLVPYDVRLNHDIQHDMVAKLNRKIDMLQLGWKARRMQQWNGRTMREINAYAGIRRAAQARQLHKQMLQQHAEPLRAHGVRSFLQRGNDARVDVPMEWDWSAVRGRSYLEPVMDQGDCGSCYAVASMRMLTSRHKIKQNDTGAAAWSINFPLFCSEYNQGCNGGYGILTARWSRDVGLLPENCMRYNTGGSCKLECDLDKLKGTRFRAANHRYVGSWYGNASTDAIQAELFQNGPLVVGLEPAEDFMFYSDGIYRTSTATPTSSFSSGNQEWERVDHAVLLVGWGVEGGQKYWKVQNSWGPDWGEGGFFRIAFGGNEAGIESIPEAADVVEDEQDGRQVVVFIEQL